MTPADLSRLDRIMHWLRQRGPRHDPATSAMKDDIELFIQELLRENFRLENELAYAYAERVI
jgi:hypothetical protein